MTPRASADRARRGSRGDARPQERALADPAGAVEQRQPGREDARRDDPPLPLAAEEEAGVALVERRQADVGRLAAGRPARRRSRVTMRRSPAAAGDSSSSRSPRAGCRARRRPGRARAPVRSRCGSFWIAQDLYAERLLPPDAVQDHAQVPVLHAVAEEEEVARRVSSTSSSAGSSWPMSVLVR